MRQVLMDPRSMQVVTAAFEAAWWLDERLGEWLFEPSATDTLTLSAPGNVTSEMGLALLDVADAIRPHPEVVAYLQTRSAEHTSELQSLIRIPYAVFCLKKKKSIILLLYHLQLHIIPQRINS